MIRRLILAAVLLAAGGCTTYGTPYYGGDYGYYDGYGYDRDYYRDDYGHYDGYGAYPYDYDDYYDYGYGYGYPYSAWGLGRYSCGYYHGCSPYGGFSISIGFFSGAPWGYYGAGWYPYFAYPYYGYPYYGYGWHHPYWSHDDDDDDDDDRGDERPGSKPLVQDETDSRVRSAPGEYLWPQPSRGSARPGGAVPQQPINGPSTPMTKPRPGMRPPTRDASLGRRYVEPSDERTGVVRPRTMERPPASRYAPVRAERPRYAEPRYGTPRAEQPRPQPQMREERPAPRYDAPAPRYDAPAPRYESPSERPAPRYEAPRERSNFESSSRSSGGSTSRPAMRESRSSSQNGDHDSDR